MVFVLVLKHLIFILWRIQEGSWDKNHSLCGFGLEEVIQLCILGCWRCLGSMGYRDIGCPSSQALFITVTVRISRHSQEPDGAPNIKSLIFLAYLKLQRELQ